MEPQGEIVLALRGLGLGAAYLVIVAALLQQFMGVGREVVQTVAAGLRPEWSRGRKGGFLTP